MHTKLYSGRKVHLGDTVMDGRIKSKPISNK